MPDPVVRVDPRDRVLHHQLWRRGILVPSRFRAGNGPGSQRRALTSDCGRRATNCVGAPRLPERPSCAAAQVKRVEPSDHRGSKGWKSQDVRRWRGGGAERGCTPATGVWIDFTLRCMTGLFCRVPRPRFGVGAPAGVDLFSGRCRDGRTCVRARQLEHLFPCFADRNVRTRTLCGIPNAVCNAREFSPDSR